MERRILIIKGIIICLIIATGGIFFLRGNGNDGAIVETSTVIYDESGFQPAEIKVKIGQTVTFINKSNKPFWPASDPHPSHGGYGQFDPRQPIGLEQSWSFVFNEEGVWNYHDHLLSNKRGVVYVGDSSRPNCSQGASGPSCWEAMILNVLETKGLDAAFGMLSELYSNDPAFASECHSYAHKLGEAAYKDFSHTGNVDITSKTSYCGYGFYHGFMESLLYETGDARPAREFCHYVGEKLKEETSDAEGACYHGIGHGAVDGSDPTQWSDPQAMIRPGLELCEAISGDASKLYRCVTGAYNAIEILSTDSKYNLKMIEENPFGLCHKQKPEYMEGCYTNMLPAVLRLTSNDFTKTLEFITALPESSGGRPVRTEVISALLHEFIRFMLQDQNYRIEYAIALCHGMKDPDRLACIGGLSGGHMKYGEPRNEYIKSLAFCTHENLYPDEENVCYRHILTRLRIWYSIDRTREICRLAPTDKRQYCSMH